MEHTNDTVSHARMGLDSIFFINAFKLKITVNFGNLVMLRLTSRLIWRIQRLVAV